ncbi:23S rRNA pseudouridine synthase F [Candidatus Kaiserbacteria bacterium]|nr:MAG: 23S rRNA pseudouridine synthase F [Candidatus Kaiserbacteria bacterium]PCI90302.1 MAG: 23S rRNA pseudouridine synthase F [Candidatus Kaiserbacteria bacterium]
MNAIAYPIRINRYLFLKNICSRREADRLIEQGKIKINGSIAVLGQKVLEADTVDVAGSAANRTYRYYLYNKPRGIVSNNPQRDEESVEDVSGIAKGVSPVGRLDKDSQGLMLLTDDGRIVNAILSPEYSHEREYHVGVDKYIKESDIRKLTVGVDIEGYLTKPAQAERLSDDSFTLTLTEGKKHQIRRMCAALGYQVLDLKRVRMMHLPLDLEEGENRELTKEEVNGLLTLSGIPLK